MTRIAQLSDVHILEPDHARREGRARWRVRYLNLGRRLDAEERLQSFRAALARAHALRVDHLLVTGDLTEDGTPVQFELAAHALHDSGFAPERVTLVPGNHDLYGGAGVWERAMAGPLRAFAASSALGVPIALAGVLLLPLSTAIALPAWRSHGRFAASASEAVLHASRDARRRALPLLVAQHHPPVRTQRPLLHWFDGMHDHAAARKTLSGDPTVYVAHGHTHRAMDRAWTQGEPARIFGAASVLEDSADAVRLYRGDGDRLLSLDAHGPKGHRPEHGGEHTPTALVG